MSGSRLTREDLAYYKRRRKKQKRIITVSISGLILIGLAILFIFRETLFGLNERAVGGELGTGTKSELGTAGLAVNTPTDNDTIPVIDTGIDSDDTTQSTTEAQIDTEIEFEVPETSLSPVEEIAGDNWYDENTYVKSDTSPVDMSYFDNTVFIGDSRTEGLLIYSGVSNLNGFSYKGLSVDKLDSDASISIPGEGGLYTCYEAISMTSYDNYYCMFGINELGWDFADVFIDEFDDLIDHIKSVNPDAVIYVESILPVSEEYSAENSVYTQERIDEYNDLLLEMCKERKDVIYLDVAAAVSDEAGYLPDEASVDGVHCGVSYCKRIIQYIRCNTFTKK